MTVSRLAFGVDPPSADRTEVIVPAGPERWIVVSALTERPSMPRVLRHLRAIAGVDEGKDAAETALRMYAEAA